MKHLSILAACAVLAGPAFAQNPKPKPAKRAAIAKPAVIAAPNKPVAEPAKPADEPAKAVDTPAKPAIEPPKPATEPEEPSVEPPKPAAEPPKPAAEPPQPAAEPPKPVAEPPQPAAEPPPPVLEPAPPADAPPKPTDGHAKPAVEPANPPHEIAKPAEEPELLGVEPAKPAVEPAKIAVEIAKPKAQPALGTGLISTDLDGRDLSFIAEALDIGKAMHYLARLAGRTENPDLQGFGDDLVKTLAAQGAVLSTLAEMRQVKVPEGDSTTQKAIADKLAKLSGAKLEKALLDTFIDLDTRLIATYEIGAKSPDLTIAKFVEQALPNAKEHLFYVQNMAGITGERPPVVGEGPPDEPAVVETPPAPPKPKPSFRTNIPLQN